jgi:hypothetical protein
LVNKQPIAIAVVTGAGAQQPSKRATGSRITSPCASWRVRQSDSGKMRVSIGDFAGLTGPQG